MLIVAENLVENGTVTASSEAAAMPASNLKILQPSVRHRMTTITGQTWIEASLQEGSQYILDYDTFALIAYDGAPHRNMLRAAQSWDTGEWTYANVDNSPIPISTSIFDGWPALTLGYFEASGDPMTVTQNVDVHASGSANFIRKVGVIAGQGGVQGDLDLIIRVYSTLTTHEANVEFDLSAGTVGTPSENGNFTEEGATITDLGNGFYLCELAFNTGFAPPNLFLRFEAAGVVLPGDDIYIGAPLLMKESDYPTDNPAEWPVVETDSGGPMWDIGYSTSAAPTSDTGWLHMATRNQLRGFGNRFNAFHVLNASVTAPYVRAWISDELNENGYIESGVFIVGKSFDLSAKLRTITLEAEESGGQQEAHGGQIYRPQRKVRRRLRLEMVALTKAQAMDSIYFLNRVKGRSRQILVIAQPDDPVYAQEQMIYGYIDSLDPIPSKASHSGDYWTWGMTMIETP